MSYATLEAALVTQLQSLSIYNTGNCVADRVDDAFKYSDEQDSSSVYHKNVAYVDYAGGNPGGERGMWTHTATLLAGVRVEGDADDAGTDLRMMLDAVWGLLWPNNTSVARRCQISRIQPPIVMERATGVWWVVFMTVEMDEEYTRC